MSDLLPRYDPLYSHFNLLGVDGVLQRREGAWLTSSIAISLKLFAVIIISQKLFFLKLFWHNHCTAPYRTSTTAHTHWDVCGLQDEVRDMSSRQVGPNLTSHPLHQLIREPAAIEEATQVTRPLAIHTHTHTPLSRSHLEEEDDPLVSMVLLPHTQTVGYACTHVLHYSGRGQRSTI